MAGGRPRRVRLTNQPRPVRNPTCGLSFLGQGVRSQCFWSEPALFTQRHNNLCPTVHVHITTMVHGI